ncbi:hypothetical protein J8273_6450 [Carpediemonas membranifera]|uniref:Uncharacterized protein n=1 Tax=Carpediemonas membranifera TaxID=201153 RepID=A0A8J6B2R4_9EUKA|nr:hypothetical protein J8273_6450 [Carpediemonas membranifera]|eukprot:KAG9391679.1 hypothetical protein J8273_6450 [Carpediemonas membranifera]
MFVSLLGDNVDGAISAACGAVRAELQRLQRRGTTQRAHIAITAVRQSLHRPARDGVHYFDQVAPARRLRRPRQADRQPDDGPAAAVQQQGSGNTTQGDGEEDGMAFGDTDDDNIGGYHAYSPASDAGPAVPQDNISFVGWDDGFGFDGGFDGFDSPELHDILTPIPVRLHRAEDQPVREAGRAEDQPVREAGRAERQPVPNRRGPNRERVAAVLESETETMDPDAFVTFLDLNAALQPINNRIEGIENRIEGIENRLERIESSIVEILRRLPE